MGWFTVSTKRNYGYWRTKKDLEEAKEKLSKLEKDLEPLDPENGENI